MRFTRRTYRAAIRRSLNLECQAFNDHLRVCRGPEQWVKRRTHTNALMARRIRELTNQYRRPE